MCLLGGGGGGGVGGGGGGGGGRGGGGGKWEVGREGYLRKVPYSVTLPEMTSVICTSIAVNPAYEELNEYLVYQGQALVRMQSLHRSTYCHERERHFRLPVRSLLTEDSNSWLAVQ